MSPKQKKYLKKIKLTKLFILVSQIFITIFFLLLWEILSSKGIINSFIFSSPSKIFKTIIDLYKNNNLLNHIYVTLRELIISFTLGTLIGFIFAILFYFVNILKKIFDPFLTLLNSLP